jgi:hypothetical protein
MTLIAPALLFAFALLLWSFAVLVWDFLEERTRGWLRVLLVVVLAPSCTLAAALATAIITSALLAALEPPRIRPARLSCRRVSNPQSPRRPPKG